MYSSSEHIEKMIANLSPAVQDVFLNLGQTRQVKKNEYLIRAGDICKHLYIVESGLFRTYRVIQKNDLPVEITSGFSFPGDFDTSPSSLVLKTPSPENIQALMDSEVIAFDFTDLDHLRHSTPQFNELIFLALMDYTAAIEEVLHDFRVLNASERYEKLLLKHPHYVQQIPLKYLASFLNMKEETLSRIRRQ